MQNPGMSLNELEDRKHTRETRALLAVILGITLVLTVLIIGLVAASIVSNNTDAGTCPGVDAVHAGETITISCPVKAGH